MIDAADYFRGLQLPDAELSRTLADLGSPRICVSFITGRCGSTFLADTAKAYGGFGTGLDALNPIPAAVWKERYPHRDLVEFVRRFLGERSMAGGVIYFQITPERWARLMELMPEHFVGMAFFSSITRRNILAQAISYTFATTSKIWHDHGEGGHDEHFALPTDAVERVQEHLDRIVRMEDAIVEFQLRHPGLFVGNVCHEDIAADPFCALATLMTMHGHAVDFPRLADAAARPPATRKLRYRAFPDLYRRCLEEIPGLAELLIRRLRSGPSTP